MTRPKKNAALLTAGRTAAGTFAPGHALSRSTRLAATLRRVKQFEARASELTEDGRVLAEELMKIANGAYGAGVQHRLQAIEMLSNRLLGKVADQHVIQAGIEPEERPYSALSADVLERLIRGLPAPLPAGDTVEGEVLPPDDPTPGPPDDPTLGK